MPGELVLKALNHVWVTLKPLHLPMGIMGGIAVAFWKHIRGTRDVDLLIQLDAGDLDKVIPTLTQAGIKAMRQPPVLSLGATQIMQLLYEPPGCFVDLQIDLLFADAPFHRQALGRRVPAHLPGLALETFVLSCEDLILLKLIAGRIIDRGDAAALLRINKKILDFPYMQTWIGQLGLSSLWSEIWEEAFPGEKQPWP